MSYRRRQRINALVVILVIGGAVLLCCLAGVIGNLLIPAGAP
jgi:hypothetical protein